MVKMESNRLNLNTKTSLGYKSYINLYTNLIKLKPSLKEQIYIILGFFKNKYFRVFAIDFIVLSEKLRKDEFQSLLIYLT